MHAQAQGTSCKLMELHVTLGLYFKSKSANRTYKYVITRINDIAIAMSYSSCVTLHLNV